MRSRAFASGLATFAVSFVVLPLHGSALAAPPVVSVTAAGTKITLTKASLTEAIDALAAAAGFKVVYEGARPAAMLFNAEIDTPSTAQTLFRLIDGQNLNYAVVFDLSGRKVASLMVIGLQSKSAGTAAAAVGGRPQPFIPPRGTRGDVPVVEDEPVVDPEGPPPAPTVSPTPSTSPLPPGGGPGTLGSPFPPSPFTPRPYGSPFGVRPSPSPSP